MSSHESGNQQDALATPNPYEGQAYLWVCAVLIISLMMVMCFLRIDRQLYDSKNLYFDFNQYRENRSSSTALAGEFQDGRRNQQYSAASEKLSK